MKKGIKCNENSDEMLIIAVPKSASTSLIETLGKTQKIKALQEFFLEGSIPESSNVIHTLHSDIRELSEEDVSLFSAKNVFYKQHIFPTVNNIELLQNVKKVILLRDPEDILKAYLRGANKRYNALPTGYSKELSQEELYQKACEDGFLKDIQFFYNEWQKQAISEVTLFINFDDYVNNTTAVVQKIEAFFNLPRTNNSVQAVKARYSRETKTRKRIRRYLKI